MSDVDDLQRRQFRWTRWRIVFTSSRFRHGASLVWTEVRVVALFIPVFRLHSVFSVTSDGQKLTKKLLTNSLINFLVTSIV